MAPTACARTLACPPSAFSSHMCRWGLASSKGTTVNFNRSWPSALNCWPVASIATILRSNSFYAAYSRHSYGDRDTIDPIATPTLRTLHACHFPNESTIRSAWPPWLVTLYRIILEHTRTWQYLAMEETHSSESTHAHMPATTPWDKTKSRLVAKLDQKRRQGSAPHWAVTEWATRALSTANLFIHMDE